MSATIKFSFQIHNIDVIHADEDETRGDELINAAFKFLEKEGLYSPGRSMIEQDLCIDFLGTEGYLAAYTVAPIIISYGNQNWIPEITKRWETMALEVVGDFCKPIVKINFVD